MTSNLSLLNSSEQRNPRKRDGRERLLAEIADETYQVYDCLKQAEDLMFSAMAMSSPERTILWTLFRDGTQTVPAIARKRQLSRQRVQQIMNGLLKSALVQRAENPAHEASPIYGVSQAGKTRLLAMLKKERRFYRDLSPRLGSPRLSAALSVLKEIRTDIEKKLNSLNRSQ